MVNIARFINELLDDHDYVIVPGLGAFKAEYLSARPDPSGTVLLPPSRHITFHRELITNDGLLLHYMAARLKLSESQVSRLIDKYTEDVLYRLETGETVVLESLGTLSFSEGRFGFAESREANILPEAYGLTSVSLISADRKSDNQTQITEQFSEGIVPFKRQKSAFRRYGWWAGIFMIFTLAGYFLFLFNNTDRSENSVSSGNYSDTTIQIPFPEKNEDSLVFTADSSRMVIPDTITKGASGTVLIHPLSGYFYLIGGSFKSEENARDYFSEIQGKGFQPIDLGKIGNFYLVAIDTFRTQRDVERAFFRFKDIYPRKDAWIYHAEK